MRQAWQETRKSGPKNHHHVDNNLPEWKKTVSYQLLWQSVGMLCRWTRAMESSTACFPFPLGLLFCHAYAPKERVHIALDRSSFMSD
jgi:hypothetical protein